RRYLDLDALDLRYFTPGAVVARPDSRSTLADPRRDPASLLDSLRSRELSTVDKLRTLALVQHLLSRREGELFAGPDASIREYLDEWGFDGGFVENFVAPFYGGITLDRSLSTSKHVFEYTFRALARGEIAVPAGGMGAIPEQLAASARRAGVEIRLDDPVETVAGNSETSRVESAGGIVEPDAVVVATDPKAARDLTGVESIPTEGRGCVTQYYRLPRGTNLKVGKKLLLNAADPAPNTVVPLSNVAPEYASPEAELLNATFLGPDALDADAEELFAETRAALSSWFPSRGFGTMDL
ncbi:FAD-dependent oxidoreductase, partial [Halobium palmae]